MDTHFVWNDEYNIGVDVIDREHKRLFKIVNKLYLLIEEDKGNKWACQEGIKFFKGHAVKHFMDEEEYMKSIGYAGLKKHKELHDKFRQNTLAVLEKELKESEYSPESIEHFLGVCAGWLIGHTVTEDRSITGKNVSKWGKLLPDKDQKDIEKVIVQLVFNMFGLESHLISDVYSGEKFGRGVYYRMVYGKDRDKDSKEIFMVFEERLLINTVGKVLGIHTNKLSNMIVHAARHTAQKFVGCVLEHIQSAEGYTMVEENLLSYEQFQKVFEKENIQVSMLMDSGDGYFAFSMIAPYSAESDTITPIDAENAMSEVEKYLAACDELKMQEMENQKPKILIVDNSTIIRHGMKSLLEDDYEIAMAESGIAAIRTITLNKPDLILLDYEMPVCDGPQVLEMLRSVKEFESIPVIFLTGRSDPDSVRKVMSLKPAGYLLKNLKQEEIKSKIDAIFDNRKNV